MGYRFIDNTTIDGLHEFIDMLNEEAEYGSVIVVEGKRDVEALNRIGFNGNLTILNHFKGITDFVDNHCQIRKKIILLLDMDRTGKHLTSKLSIPVGSIRETMSIYFIKKHWPKLLMERSDRLKTLADICTKFVGGNWNKKGFIFLHIILELEKR